MKKQNIALLITIITGYILIFINKTWMIFVDESDNFAGGWLISKGYVLYKDLFSHHMPFPYYYASLLIKLGLNDVNGLRIGMGLTILFFWLLLIVIFKDKIDYRILCILIFLSAIAHPIFWGHMFLADTFFAYSILIIFLYFFSKPQLNFNIKDKIVISLMIYISIMSTLISLYPICMLGIYYGIKKSYDFYAYKLNIKNTVFGELKFLVIIFTPFILSLFYFYSAGSLQEFFNEAYLFNKLYYAQFTGTLTELQFFEPIKAYSQHIFFYISNFDWLTNNKSFLWEIPPWNNTLSFFEGFLVISNIIVLVIFWKKRNSCFSIFYFSFLAFLRFRGEQFNENEWIHGSGWFHGSPYYLLSFFSIGFIITESYESLKTYKLLNSNRPTNQVKVKTFLIVLYGFLAIILLGVLSCAYVSNGSGTGSNDVYVSPYNKIIQTLTQPDDTIWVAPLDPSLYFINKRLPASRYTFYLPWQAVSDKINKELIEDLKINKPPLIIFNRDADIWGYLVKDYGKTIDDYIQQNYYRVDTGDPIYKNVYLIKTKRIQLLNTLFIRGLIVTPYANVIMNSTSLNVSAPVNTPTFFAVATLNVGGANATDVSFNVVVPLSIKGLAVQVNQTYPINGTIKGSATGLTISVGAENTFAVFLIPTQAISFDPINNSITLQLVDGSGKVIGAQSVAVSTI